MYDIVWHGRGGQGVVIAAQILAESAYLQSFKGVTSAPTFGPERRGAPVTASTRIAGEPIRTFSQIEMADTVIVMDESLFKVVNIMARVKKGGLIIINTALPENIEINGCLQVASVNAAGIALKHRLMAGGSPVVNTPLLGAFAKATGLVSLENIEKVLKKKLSRDIADTNFAAVCDAYNSTILRAS
jgi:2-oxoacid:acceptor oxidoreductase gamma subunit (pyruvate/2-ketoisovalerate family)